MSKSANHALNKGWITPSLIDETDQVGRPNILPETVAAVDIGLDGGCFDRDENINTVWHTNSPLILFNLIITKI